MLAGVVGAGVRVWRDMENEALRVKSDTLFRDFRGGVVVRLPGNGDVVVSVNHST